MSERRTVALVTLGCARNDVDSEELAGRLAADGWDLVEDPNGADIAVVNTCGFVEAAKKDSIDTLIAAADAKEEGTGPKAVVAVGCLAERYGQQLAEALPEADAVLSFDDYQDISSRLGAILHGERLISHVPRDRRTLLPLTPADRRDFVQLGRGIDDHAARLTFDHQRLGAQMHHQLAAVITGGRVQPHGGGQVGTMDLVAEAHMRDIGMGAISHAHLVTGQKRRGDMARKGEIAERFRPRIGAGHDPGRFRIMGIGLVGLKVVLGLVVGIGDPPVDKLDLEAEFLQPRDFRRVQKIFYFQKHRLLPNSGSVAKAKGRNKRQR